MTNIELFMMSKVDRKVGNPRRNLHLCSNKKRAAHSHCATLKNLNYKNMAKKVKVFERIERMWKRYTHDLVEEKIEERLKVICETHEKEIQAIREEIREKERKNSEENQAIRDEIREKERKNSEEIQAIREEIREIERKNSNVFKTLFVENMIHDEAMKILNTKQEKPVKDVCNSVALQLSRKLNVPVSEIDKILYRYFPELK